MRDLTDLLTAELAAEQATQFWFLELEFDTVQRYTDCDIDLYLTTTSGGGHNKYSGLDFSIPNIGYSSSASVDKLTIDIQNVDLVLSATLLNEDVLNTWCTLFVAYFDDDNIIVSEPIEVFKGLVSTWKLSEKRASITIVNEFIFWNKHCLRNHPSKCMWPFKGTECGYSGAETWCDQDYPRCLVLGNTDNFGGFRWLPTLTEQKIYWGRTTERPPNRFSGNKFDP